MENGLFDIMELLHEWHNAKMAGEPWSKERIQETRRRIVDLAGLDTDKIIEICDEIDGCCLEIAQNKTITKEHLLAENDAIDHCSTLLRALVENIGE